MDTEIQAQSLKPWLSIWAKPRSTIRWIVDTDPARQVILLATISGIARFLVQAAERDFGDTYSVSAIFMLALAAGPIGGLISLYIGGALLRWTGSWFDGGATSEEVRAAIAWSSVPSIWALLLWIPELLLFGKDLFTTVTPRIDANPLLRYLMFPFAAVEIVVSIWRFIVLLQCLGEVHRFSAWKALGAVLIPGLVLLGFACVGMMLMG